MADIDYKTYVDKIVDGRWRLVRFIGKGGFGAVFEAVREFGLQKDRRALKLLKPDAPKSVRQRFAREFNLTDVIVHPNAVRVYEYDQDRELGFYIVMTLVDGQDLKVKLESGPLGVDEGLRVSERITEALEAAHRIGIIHRDIKPGNILLSRSGVAYLADWGIAKRIHDDTEVDADDDPSITEGEAPHTVRYASTEQLRHEPLEPSSDIFSLGAVLYEIFAGKRFLEDVDPKYLRSYKAYKPPWPEVPLPFDHLPQPLDEEIVDVIRKCVRLEAEDRYPDASALLAAIRRVRARLEAVEDVADPEATQEETYARQRSDLRARIDALLPDLRSLHELLRNGGLDAIDAAVDVIDRGLERAREHERAQEFKQALTLLEDFADRVETTLREAEDHVQRFCREARDDIARRWAELQARGAEIEDGVATSINEGLQSADDYINQRSWATAITTVDRTAHLLRDAEIAVREATERALAEGWDRFDRLAATLAEVADASVDVGAEAARAESARALEADELGAARKVAEDCWARLESHALEVARGARGRALAARETLASAAPEALESPGGRELDSQLAGGEQLSRDGDPIAAIRVYREVRNSFEALLAKADEKKRRAAAEAEARTKLDQVRDLGAEWDRIAEGDAPTVDVDATIAQGEQALTGDDALAAAELAAAAADRLAAAIAARRQQLTEQAEQLDDEITALGTAVDFSWARQIADAELQAYEEANARAQQTRIAGDDIAAAVAHRRAAREALARLAAVLSAKLEEERNSLAESAAEIVAEADDLPLPQDLAARVEDLPARVAAADDHDAVAAASADFAQVRAAVRDVGARVVRRQQFQARIAGLDDTPPEVFGDLLQRAQSVVEAYQPPPVAEIDALAAQIEAARTQVAPFMAAREARTDASSRLRRVEERSGDVRGFRARIALRGLRRAAERADAAFAAGSWDAARDGYAGLAPGFEFVEAELDREPSPPIWGKVLLGTGGVAALVLVGWVVWPLLFPPPEDKEIVQAKPSPNIVDPVPAVPVAPLATSTRPPEAPAATATAEPTPEPTAIEPTPEPTVAIPTPTSTVVVVANRAPVVERAAGSRASTVRADRGSRVDFGVAADDPDGDPLFFTWTVDGQKQADDDATLRLRVDRDRAVVVAVDDRKGDGPVEIAWSLVAVDRPFAFTPDPAPGRIDLAFGEGRSFALRPADGTELDGVTFRWQLAGSTVSRRSSWRFANDDARLVAGGARKLTVVATRGEERIEESWDVDVEAPSPLRLTRGAPSDATAVAAPGAAMTFTARSENVASGQDPTYIFEVDGEVAAESKSPTFRFEPSGGSHQIVARAVDVFGQPSANEIRWNVSVAQPIRALLDDWVRTYQRVRGGDDVDAECRVRGMNASTCGKLKNARQLQKSYSAGFPSAAATSITGADRATARLKIQEEFRGPDNIPVSLVMDCSYDLRLRDGRMVVDRESCRRAN